MALETRKKWVLRQVWKNVYLKSAWYYNRIGGLFDIFNFDDHNIELSDDALRILITKDLGMQLSTRMDQGPATMNGANLDLRQATLNGLNPDMFQAMMLDDLVG